MFAVPHLLRLLSRRAAWLLLACAVLAPATPAADAAAFDPERGLPLMQRFLPEVYQGHYQVNDLTVAPDGRLYGTTQRALVRYDGTRWERLPFPTLWAWRLVATADGRVYVSGDDEIGYFADDPTGRTVYHSLVAQVPAAALPLGNVRGAKAARHAVAFAAEKGWLVWQDGAFHFTPSPVAGRTIVHSAADTLFASVTGGGLHRWDGRTWQPFATSTPAVASPSTSPANITTPLTGTTVTALATLPGKRLLALSSAPAPGTPALVALNLDGTPAAPWTGPGAAALLAVRPLGLLTLPDGRIAAFTRQSGLALASADGSTFWRYEKSHGLPSNTTYGLAVDHHGGLWVGGTNGLARLDLATPATVFDERNAPGPGGMRSFSRQDGVFYAGVVEAVHRLVPANPATGAPARFERIPGTTTTINDVAPHPAGLLVAATNTLHLYRPDTGFRPLLQRKDDLSVVWTTPADPARIYVGGDKTLLAARLDPTGAQLTIDYDSSTFGSSELLTPVGADTVWVGTRARGFFRVRSAAGSDGWRTPAIEQFAEKEGLPPTRGYTAVFTAPWGPAFFTTEGTWQLEETTRRFTPEPAFQFADGPRYGFPSTLDTSGRLWASGGRLDNRDGRPLGWYEFAPGTPRRAATWHPAPPALQPFAGAVGFLTFYRDPVGDIIWGKSPQAVLRIEAARLAALPATPWQPRLHALSAAGTAQPLAPATPPRYAASSERTFFRLSPGRLDGGAVTYRTRLLGHDARWSAPSAHPEISFTNLEGGPFTLEVIATDGAGRDSTPLRFAFSVAPPWQRSPAAYVLYTLAALTAIAAYLQWRLGRAKREQRRLEALVAMRTSELATARDAAEAASRAKSAFLAAMSHELRTPLNGVIGYAQVLQDDRRLLSDQRERLRIVQNSGEHLLRMINDVLDLAKIEAGKLELRPAPFALADLVRDIVAAHAPTAAAKRLTFTTELAPDLPPWVEGDAQKLRQILDNLLGNAVKFTAHGSVMLRVVGGRVPAPAFDSANSPRQPHGHQAPSPSSTSPLPLQPPGEGIAFAVQDTGPGIDATDQARLFQPFEQATRSRPHAPGAGLGLAISRALVERLGGSLFLSSEPGHGSTFAFSVPLPAVAPDPTVATRSRRLTGYDGPRRHVLIVDDHAINRSLLTDLLVPLGFTCSEFPSGEAALAHLALIPHAAWPDLAILDVRMQGLDGLELTRRLRQHSPHPALKILLTSASVLTFDPAQGRAAGCDDFLPKPFRTADLVEKITALLALTWRSADSASPFAPASFPTSEPFPSSSSSQSSPLPSALRDALRELLAQGDLDAFRAALTAARPLHPACEPRFAELEAAAAAFELSRLRLLLDQP